MVIAHSCSLQICADHICALSVFLPEFDVSTFGWNKASQEPESTEMTSPKKLVEATPKAKAKATAKGRAKAKAGPKTHSQKGTKGVGKGKGKTLKAKTPKGKACFL